ncbi:MAG: TetR/AcrR family transcriptional regulator [Treponema sp.]|jgi:AcrR family transcriptional regulator|nr:TetR/AcrR family transcriptional regulator [Treponema sp.]
MDKSVEKKENRKTRYTRMVIRQSLTELMKEKPILSITVKDICDLADISRSTFYIHYKDQYDLLKQIEDETLAYFEDILNSYKDKQSKKDTYEMVEEMLTYIANNGNTIHVLLSEKGDIDFQKKLLYYFIMHNQITKYFSEKLSEETRPYYSVFLVHGAIGLIQHWLKDGMTLPVPQLAKMLMKWTEHQIKM